MEVIFQITENFFHDVNNQISPCIFWLLCCMHEGRKKSFPMARGLDILVRM